MESSVYVMSHSLLAFIFATMMKSSVYVISHSLFVFSTLLFRGKVIDSLNVLLLFNISNNHTHFFRKDLQLHECADICAGDISFFECLANYSGTSNEIFFARFSLYHYVRVIFISKLVSLMFRNLAVLLKRCFTRINTRLHDQVQRAGEESLGLYIQMSIVKDTQPLIKVN
jgi:hypothetical protein